MNFLNGQTKQREAWKGWLDLYSLLLPSLHLLCVSKDIYSWFKCPCVGEQSMDIIYYSLSEKRNTSPLRSWCVSLPPCSLQHLGAGPAVECPLPTQVPMPTRPQGWWGRNPLVGTGRTGQLISLIRSTSILTSLCPSTALNPSRSSGNDIMRGGKQLATWARLAVTEQGNSFCIPFSLLSNSLNNWISPHRASSQGIRLTSAFPTIPSLQRAQGFSQIQITSLQVFSCFPGIPITSCIKSAPPLSTPANPLALGAQGPDSQYPYPVQLPDHFFVIGNEVCIQKYAISDRQADACPHCHQRPPWA